MTTKDKIKALIGADKLIAQVIGALPHLCDCEDKQENAAYLAAACDIVQDVINALCDELPDHIANPGKKVFVGDSRTELGLQDPEHIADLGKMMYGGQPVNLCAKEATKCMMH